MFWNSCLAAADIRTGLEVEFRTFYFPVSRPQFSFQMREAKLFFDTFISDHASALIEFRLQEGLKKSGLDRGYFVWLIPRYHSQIKFGQIRIPFGFWDPYTITRSLIKGLALGEDDFFRGFKLRKLDVGFEFQSNINNLNIMVGVVNGNSIDAVRDENDQKDFFAKVGFQMPYAFFHLSSYFGTASPREDVPASVAPGNKTIRALGGDFLFSKGKLTISGEMADIKYGDAHSIGGYGQFSYDLLSVVYGLRLIGRVEYLDRDKNSSGDEVWQNVFGIKQTLARGTTMQIEYRYHSRQFTNAENGVLLEIEVEL